jgi:uncharacterized protein YndB with AHSA1/START domain
MKMLIIVAASFIAVLCASATPNGGILTTEAVVEAPVADVWKAWTEREQIENWMVGKTEFELKVGSTWKTSYSKDSNLNDDSSIHHTVLAFDPERMFSFRTVKTPKGFPFPEALAKTWCVVYFDPIGKGRTRVTLKMLGYDDTDDSKKMRAFFERGNKATLDALVKKFAKS